MVDAAHGTAEILDGLVVAEKTGADGAAISDEFEVRDVLLLVACVGCVCLCFFVCVCVLWHSTRFDRRVFVRVLEYE